MRIVYFVLALIALILAGMVTVDADSYRDVCLVILSIAASLMNFIALIDEKRKR